MSTPALLDYTSQSVNDALAAVAAQNNSLLLPEHVREAARDEASPLHCFFTWGDGEAAEKYRLLEAASLIRKVKVWIARNDPGIQRVSVTVTRAFESRASVRKLGGGYEKIDDIMSDEAKRADMVQTAMGEFMRLRKKYEKLSELGALWETLDGLQVGLMEIPN